MPLSYVSNTPTLPSCEEIHGKVWGGLEREFIEKQRCQSIENASLKNTEIDMVKVYLFIYF